MKQKRRGWICLVTFCLLLGCWSALGFASSPDAGGKAMVNINTASADELAQLPRIGDKVAQRVVDYREKNGSFKSVEDLKSVNGIGDKLLEHIRPMITVK